MPGKKSSPPVDGWPDAYRQQSAMRFASAMVRIESIRFHTQVVRVRLGSAMRSGSNTQICPSG